MVDFLQKPRTPHTGSAFHKQLK